MRNRVLIAIIVLFFSNLLFGQQKSLPNNIFQNDFDFAYSLYPDIPKGMLEAVAFTTTHFQHIINTQESCTEIPAAYGVMGLTLDGKNYFRNNLDLVAQLSGVQVNDIIQNSRQNILAYASAYNQLLLIATFDKVKIENHSSILVQLSELPYNGITQDFALNTHLYSVFSFLSDVDAQYKYGFPNHHVSLESVFGTDNLKVLSSSKIIINENTVSTSLGQDYSHSNLVLKSVDYPPALTSLTPCNFSSRSGTPISAVTVHTIQGTYAGAISWAANCSLPSNVSYHYVLRSSDGQVTQVVLESNKAWHVGSENPYTIGMEHDGYVTDSTWYTAALYQSSADVVKDITLSGYGINPKRTAYFPWSPTTNYNVASIPGSCVTIKGHQHYPNQSHTDPGKFWDWDYYYKLINNTTPIITNNNVTGTVRDLGGTGNYTNDERTLYLIQPTGATSITLNIAQFDVESTWDYLYVYNGTTPFSSRVGFYTGTTIPTTLTINSGNVLIEFRSDCSTVRPGFEINWTSTVPDTIKPTTLITGVPNPTYSNFTAGFTDADNVGGSGILHRFYQVIDNNGVEWRANGNNGFFNDNFDVAIHPDWIIASGTWNIGTTYLMQTDGVNSNSNIYTEVNQNSKSKYLYHWEGKIEGTGANRRGGFHFMSDDASLTNRGNSYFVWFRLDDNKIQIYKVVNDTFSLKLDIPYNFTISVWYDIKVTFDKTGGDIDVYVNNILKAWWKDSTPFVTGNFVSFRSGNAVYTINNLKIYHDRSSSEVISVGSGSTNDIRYEGYPAGKINSIVIDNAKNISTVGEDSVNVDWLTTINNINIDHLKFYPNPVKEALFVEFNKSIQSVNVIVKDLLNREVLVTQFEHTDKITINVSALNNGVYLVEILGNDAKKVFKFLKE